MAKGKYVTCTAEPVEGIENALSEIEELRDEMVEWRDNMSSNNMEHLEKYEAVSAAADELEQAELDASDLVSHIQEAMEGADFVAGCPEHVVGHKCARCGWDGKLGTPPTMPRSPLIPDAELRWRFESWFSGGDPKKPCPKWELCVAARGNCVWEVSRPAEYRVVPRAGSMFPKLEPVGPVPVLDEEVMREVAKVRSEAQEKHEEECQRVQREIERCTSVPKRRPDTPAVPPVPGMEEALTKHVEWTEFRKYGKGALSRADRLGNALTELRACLEAVQEAVAVVQQREDLNDAQRESLNEIESDLEQLSEVPDNLEGIEFPGMFS